MKNTTRMKMANQTKECLTLAPPIEAPIIDIVADEEDCATFIKISGFEYFEDCVEYSNWLATYLPLLLCKTEVVQ